MNNEIPEKFRELALDSNIINTALYAYDRNLFTKEQFYNEIIFALIDQNKNLKKDLLNLYKTNPTIIKVNNDEK